MAPEVVKGGGHDIAVDWWSLGVLTYELLTGASPFTVEGDRNTQPDISKRILNLEPMMPEFLGPDVKDFILKLLIKDPRKRLGTWKIDYALALWCQDENLKQSVVFIGMADDELQ